MQAEHKGPARGQDAGATSDGLLFTFVSHTRTRRALAFRNGPGYVVGAGRGTRTQIPASVYISPRG